MTLPLTTSLDRIPWNQVVFVDTETFGLDPRTNPVWEIAVVLGPHEHQWHQWFVEVRDVDIARAHPDALRMTRFEERYDHENTINPTRTCERLVTMLGNRHLIGAVPSFDEERLRKMMWDTGVIRSTQMPWHYHLIDVETLMVGVLAERGIVPDLPWKSHELSALLGVEPTPPELEHTALADALWAMRCCQAVWSTQEF